MTSRYTYGRTPIEKDTYDLIKLLHNKFQKPVPCQKLIEMLHTLEYSEVSIYNAIERGKLCGVLIQTHPNTIIPF
jgi:hypothetical protein